MWRPARCSVFSEVAIKDGNIDGYVKPMFANLKVYDYQKDKGTGVLHQAKELAIGGASHLFKNSSTRAGSDRHRPERKTDESEHQYTGRRSVQVLRNAFIEAIIPGFDRAVGSNAGANPVKQAEAH